jgi:glycosyltransferase involved in cell wall biosynthesis
MGSHREFLSLFRGYRPPTWAFRAKLAIATRLRWILRLSGRRPSSVLDLAMRTIRHDASPGSGGRRVLIVGPVIRFHDAVGNDILMQQEVLQQHGWTVLLAADETSLGISLAGREELALAMDDPTTWVIYHHSIAWPKAEHFLNRCAGKILVKYHNITPDHFYAPWFPAAAEACRLGRDQIARLLCLRPGLRVLCDSAFNQSEVQHFLPPDATMVVPPFGRYEDFLDRGDNRGEPPWLGMNGPVALFVGRIVPNKGHGRLLEVLAATERLGLTQFSVVVIGGYDTSLDRYYRWLHHRACELGVQDRILFTGAIPFDQLRDAYARASFLLCVSEHEGFCVPVVEAQVSELPVIATDDTAVGETVADAGICLPWDADAIAQACHHVLRDPAWAEDLRQRGRQNCQRFQRDQVAQALLKGLGPT